MKFTIATLFAVTSLTAVFLASLSSSPLWGFGLLIIVLPNIIALIIATKIENRNLKKPRDKIRDKNAINGNLQKRAGLTKEDTE